MAIDPTKVPRFAHGSRVPGWDEAADMTKDPAVVPDPATTPHPEMVSPTLPFAVEPAPPRPPSPALPSVWQPVAR